MTEKNPTDKPAPLVEGRDYYMERGYFVLTEHYLLRRGFCCGNGCRHCPYGRRKSTSPKYPGDKPSEPPQHS